METLKDIFFFIGSTLGIFAFIRTLVAPALKTNKEKWQEVLSHLEEEDLSNLQYQVYVKRRVDLKLLNKVYSFASDIEKDAEYLRLGPPFRQKFEKHKERIAELHYDLRDYIQNPYWKRMPLPDNDYNEPARQWHFDKEYFYAEVEDGHEKYTDHLKEASDIVDEMRVHFRALSYLSNLHVFETPLAGYLVNKRSKLPKR